MAPSNISTGTPKPSPASELNSVRTHKTPVIKSTKTFSRPHALNKPVITESKLPSSKTVVGGAKAEDSAVVKNADPEGKKNEAFRALRVARSDAKLVGVREKRARLKAEQAEASKK
ncbi:MAG: hypothetical protein M1831_000855 [Alyxoria varia]|nr:MAG: hypothetical protein M1831_000855 [Alyxoria varia]